MNNEILKHEELKQCAIFAYGKNKNLPEKYKHTNTCSYTKTDGTKVDNYIRTCYVHGNPIKSYTGKSYVQMSENERDEFLSDYI